MKVFGAQLHDQIKGISIYSNSTRDWPDVLPANSPALSLPNHSRLAAGQVSRDE